MLAILAGASSTDKISIRYTVAHYYIVFSIAQMLFLSVFAGATNQLVANLHGAALSGLIYLAIGSRIFVRTANPVFDTSMTAFMAAYGLVVLARLWIAA